METRHPYDCLCLNIDVHFLRGKEYVSTFEDFNIFFSYENKKARQIFGRAIKPFNNGALQVIDKVIPDDESIIKKVLSCTIIRYPGDYKTDQDVTGFYVSYIRNRRKHKSKPYYGKIFR